MEKNNNGNTNEVLEQVKLELESEKFKNSYSEELVLVSNLRQLFVETKIY
ncbi:hypothetical protein [Vagococcus salmoninarum]